MRNRPLYLLVAALALAGCEDVAAPPTPAETAAALAGPDANPLDPEIPPATVALLPAAPKARPLPNPLLDLQPTSLEATLSPGETVTEHKVVDLPAVPPSADVVFAVDLTGSMGSELSNMQVNSNNIMNGVAASIADVRFAFVSYEDYPLTFFDAGANCGYASTYGSGPFPGFKGDEPWRLDQPLTTSTVDVSTAINAAQLGGGADYAESYSRAFYELYAELIGDPNPTEGTLGWRPGARKIVVNWGDAIPHDCDVYGILGGGGTTGRDPGRDNAVGTADDLAILDVLDGLAANNVTMINLNSGGDGVLWAAYMTRAGGINYNINPNATFPGGVDPVATIVDLINSAVSTVSTLTLEVCSGDEAYAAWIAGVSPASHTDVTLPATREFDLTLGPPAGTAPGTYSFSVCAMGDGAEFGRQDVTITVPEPVIPITIRVEPESIKLNAKGDGTITVFVSHGSGFNPADVDPASIILTNGTGAGTPLSKKNNGSWDYVVNPTHGVYKFSRTALITNGDLTAGTTVLYLKGQISGGGPNVEGSDNVSVIP